MEINEKKEALRLEILKYIEKHSRVEGEDHLRLSHADRLGQDRCGDGDCPDRSPCHTAERQRV